MKQNRIKRFVRKPIESKLSKNNNCDNNTEKKTTKKQNAAHAHSATWIAVLAIEKKKNENDERTATARL